MSHAEPSKIGATRTITTDRRARREDRRKRNIRRDAAWEQRPAVRAARGRHPAPLRAGERLMSAADIVTAAIQIVDPNRARNEPFPGTFEEAIDAMVAFAGMRWDQARLTEALRNSDPDRVAEVCAGALLRLANGGIR